MFFSPLAQTIMQGFREVFDQKGGHGGGIVQLAKRYLNPTNPASVYPKNHPRFDIQTVWIIHVFRSEKPLEPEYLEDQR